MTCHDTQQSRCRTGWMLALVSFVWLTPIGAAVNWTGGPILADVTDQNINLSNTNTIGTGGNPSAISVNAVTTDITVTVTGAAVIQGEGGANGTAKLCLNAAAGQTIRFVVPSGGSTNFIANSTALTQPFLVLVTGAGTVEFLLDGNSSVRLSDTDAVVANQQGTRMFVVMTGTAQNPGATLRVRRNTATGVNLNQFAGFFIERSSFLSYLANDAVSIGGMTSVGRIIFDAGNTLANPSGLLQLNIMDRSGVIVSGHLYSNNAGCAITFNDIDMSVPAGLEAQFITTNSSDFSSLIVVNSNTTLNSALPVPATNSLLINPFCIDQIFPDQLDAPYTGLLYGFTVQANGAVDVGSGSYIFYLASAPNMNPLPFLVVSCNRLLSQYMKERNPSSMTFDDNLNVNATPPIVRLHGESALYLAGNSDCSGCSWFHTVNPGSGAFELCDRRLKEIGGAGIIAMDVEGRLTIQGDPGRIAALNVLSLTVNSLGGSVNNNALSTIFPLRNYRTWTDGSYQRFPRTSIMVRGELIFQDVTLKHDDLSHDTTVEFLPGNFLVKNPEPTYIGAEPGIVIAGSDCLDVSACPVPMVTCPGGARTIQLVNADVELHSSANSSGLTWLVPNVTDADSNSNFHLYSNGRCVVLPAGSQNTGVSFILGSLVGSVAADGSTVLNPDAYLYVQQTALQTVLPAIHRLDVTGLYNNNKFWVNLPADSGVLAGQFNVHAFTLLYGSNIALGTDTTATPSPFPLVTHPTLNVNASYVQFVSQGGVLQDPSSSGSTGKGGIFVDTDGRLVTPSTAPVSFDSTTVAYSGDGQLNFTPSQTFYGAGSGVQQWALNLAVSNLIIPGSALYNEYTFDWQNTIKDCAYVPYVPNFSSINPAPAFNPAANTPVVPDNLINLPTVQGTVDGQFQIRNSRVGDTAQLVVDGGLIREVVFLNDNTPGVAALGTIIIQNGGTIGLGTANRSYDSIFSQIVLGAVKGVTLVANGDGQVLLNQDVIIDDYCHILTGPAFGAETAQQLLITSEVPREIRVKKGGTLDLSQFDTYNKRLAIGGQVTIVFEPGSQLLLGGGELFFVGDAQMTFEPFSFFNFPTPTTVAGTDPYRVRIGSFFTQASGDNPSRLTFKEGSRCFVPRNALVSVQTLPTVTTATYQSWLLTDDARLEIGNSAQYGGGLQIGDPAVYNNVSAVNWALTLDGLNATVEIEGQGFLGIGMGVVNKPNSAPGTWTIGRLFNVGTIALFLTQGTLNYRTLYDSSNVNAGLMAIYNGITQMAYSASRSDSLTLGGGNVILVPAASTSNIQPVVTTAISYGVGTGAYSAGILASSLTLLNYSKSGTLGDPMVVTAPGAQAVFTFITMDDYINQNPAKTVAVTPLSLGSQGIGYIYNSLIFRQTAGSFRLGSAAIGASSSLAIGAAGGAIDVSDPAVPAMSLTVVNGNGLPRF